MTCKTSLKQLIVAALSADRLTIQRSMSCRVVTSITVKVLAVAVDFLTQAEYQIMIVQYVCAVRAIAVDRRRQHHLRMKMAAAQLVNRLEVY